MKSREWPGGSVGGVPRFNPANTAHVERSNKPTMSTVTAADGDTLKVVTRVRDGVLEISVYRGNEKHVPIMRGEFCANGEG